MTEYKDIGIKVPKILLPNENIDLTKWAVVACDQYTSEPDYWNKVKEFVGEAPSTLNIIIPEIYLEEPGKQERIEKIQKNMEKYVKEEILIEKEGFIYIERKIENSIRPGLIVAIDLEKYDYSKGSQTLVRATEGTILDRIPPRVEIRKDAKIELPHIMVLIDDPEKTVIESLKEIATEDNKLYDFELMMNSGQIKGYSVPEENNNVIAEAIRKLANPEVFKNKYGVDGKKGVLLFAMGDGNHSLATAKAIWEQKKSEVGMNHPCRYALVELNNVHDDSLVFEPIHRVLFNMKKDFFEEINAFYSDKISIEKVNSKEEMMKNVDNSDAGLHKIGLVNETGFSVIKIQNPEQNLEAGTIQVFLDKFLKEDGFEKIDYVHGTDVVVSLGQESGNTGIYLPAMDKNELFRTVILDGALPRKTFSMGEASEKRFYLECRSIE